MRIDKVAPAFWLAILGCIPVSFFFGDSGNKADIGEDYSGVTE